MRALYPDTEGYVERDGVKVFYEAFGDGEPTLLMLPTWTFAPSRVWKAQVPHLARHFRVVTIDPRGNGRSDRPVGLAAYAEREFAADALAVMEATDTERAVLVGLSLGAQRTLLLAAEHPERVLGAAFIGPFFPASFAPGSIRWRLMANPRVGRLMERQPFTTRGWFKFNSEHWRRDYGDFVSWWAQMCASEPHSTKQIEDITSWGLGSDAVTLWTSANADLAAPPTREGQRKLARRLSCPVLVINGTEDRITPIADARALARSTGGRLLAIEGGGHVPMARTPVPVNAALRDFTERVSDKPRRDPTAYRANGRRRALYVSSPIGLGHARRDVAIARELRALVPDLEVEWLAQNPVTRVLEAEGETIHPASRHLANESGHFESESAEHDLHCFQAWRRMDEILVANYMVFHDLVRERPYDLWIGDEAWELDYYLHEHPKNKLAPYVWLTDFVGWLPMTDGGDHEAYLTADYNAEMVEHIAASPDVRDRALFVGNPDDIVPDRLGPQLPLIRDWTERNFDFSGYVSGFDPAAFGDRERLRAELGYRPGEQVCIVTVGGSGVGASLLRRVMSAFGEAKERVPDLRMIVVAGPRIDPASLPRAEGLQVCPYVHDLYRHLAACDLAVVQGGLTTAMELTAARRPFLYFPLAHHFEQNFHVRHRLERYGAGRPMDFEESTTGDIAAAIADEIGRDVDYRPVETNGARRAAERIAEVL